MVDGPRTVGVAEAPFNYPGSSDLAEVVECDKCFENVWWHISPTRANALYEEEFGEKK